MKEFNLTYPRDHSVITCLSKYSPELSAPRLSAHHVIHTGRGLCLRKVHIYTERAEIQTEQVVIFGPLSSCSHYVYYRACDRCRWVSVYTFAHPWECLLLFNRRRRIKCDEGHPCQACLGAHSACTFEEPGKRNNPHKSKFVAHQVQLILSYDARTSLDVPLPWKIVCTILRV